MLTISKDKAMKILGAIILLLVVIVLAVFFAVAILFPEIINHDNF